jgi:NADPH:quinone reductase
MMLRASIAGSTLRSRDLADKTLAIRAFGHAVVPLLAAGTVSMPIEARYRAQDAAAAFAHLERPGKFGKVLLDFEE